MESEHKQPTSVPSEVPESLSKGFRKESGPNILGADYDALQDRTEALDINMAGNTVILSPNSIRIERIPFSTYGTVRGQLQ